MTRSAGGGSELGQRVEGGRAAARGRWRPAAVALVALALDGSPLARPLLDRVGRLIRPEAFPAGWFTLRHGDDAAVDHVVDGC